MDEVTELRKKVEVCREALSSLARENKVLRAKNGHLISEMAMFERAFPGRRRRSGVRSAKEWKVLSVLSALHKAGREQARSDLEMVRSELGAVRAVVGRVVALHVPGDSWRCLECGLAWPCPTAILVKRA